MINALLFLILFAILFPRSLKFLLALIFIGRIMILGEVQAAVDCQDIAAFQVASEPGVKECITTANAHFRKVISPDCHAVIKASMTKRIHECQKAVAEF